MLTAVRLCMTLIIYNTTQKRIDERMLTLAVLKPKLKKWMQEFKVFKVKRET